MAHIRELFAAVAEKLALNKPLLARARRRYKANRKRAFKNHKRGTEFQERADLARGTIKGGYPNPTMAASFDKAADRCHHRAFRSHQRAQWWLGRIKALVQRIHGLDQSQAQLEDELKKLRNVTITGNHAEGGTKHERLKVVALASAAACASGRRANFYSQAGAWDVSHCITGEEYGERSDCSSWVTSVYKACGLSDPNDARYTGGYTGTLVAAGREISRLELKPGDLVIYGSGTGHHVEMYVGPGDKTIGHGSAPVDAGVIDLFGDRDYRCFNYID